ncbi:non-canonical purine NTP pyrophosphatase [[Acholeplasma] multilocale]|uniref:non-canonical purine NTP pyrophosphatase n=1 Tax=[Acholeplasma] multilocale TaxID=264638 RepID=UPI00047D8931|nr:non-canonical purine NTP pyrophosphatase [[Acholeplasma] multilocale]
MERQTLWIATSNPGKADEFKHLLPEFEVKTLLDLTDYHDIEEDGTTFEENAMIKAKDLAIHVKGIAVGDDSGICIESLDNFPGIHSKRWAEPLTDWNEISQLLVDKIDESATPNKRVARMVTCLAFYDARNQQEYMVKKSVVGKIAKQVIRSDKGFGYDNIFIPTPGHKTYAELGRKTKNKSSSRKLAVRAFKEFINNYEV